MNDVTGGQDEPKRPVVSRRRGLGKGLGAILPSPEEAGDERSRRDQLTGLPNRSELDERFDEAMARCRQDDASLAVLVVALDGFSVVNELYGHNVGDDLLHDAAARLSEARRKSDTVARFAGDEFVVVCPYVASGDLACQMAARILEDLSRPVTVDKVELQLSASIGVVVTAPGTEGAAVPTLETLLGDASLAMRLAKDEGGGSWKLFDPSMREHVAVRSQSRQDLRAALDDDGLVLEYEDIVDLATGAAIGESAILGWSQPGPDADQPQAPLDLVDEAGLAVPIGTWVLDRALADLANRHVVSRLPSYFRVWVKVAPTLVADPALLDIVDELTAKHDVSPSVLGLDIREPSAAALASTETNLRALYERDVVVGFDDFGAGQSNLTLLQRLPISGLKLAPDLVAALDDDPGVPDMTVVDADNPPGHHPSAVVDADTATPATGSPAAEDVDDRSADAASRAVTLRKEAAALVRGLIQLGRALELTVVAQGVESEAQLTALRALGCEYAQGPFLVGRAATLGVVADPAWEDGSDDAPEDVAKDASEDPPESESRDEADTRTDDGDGGEIEAGPLVTPEALSEPAPEAPSDPAPEALSDSAPEALSDSEPNPPFDPSDPSDPSDPGPEASAASPEARAEVAPADPQADAPTAESLWAPGTLTT